ncbi:recombinase RecF [Thermococcus profundus]|uniref:Recombinase RecF n=1 Tax=Thermococcus profundus TaxID=49899 RepID=A0A2Z2MB83_THEPR|nr:AAA family ATPase [Thermococcus profundus]ASJ01862.1 recombinase RecF [Thermococcus profundus]
MRLKKLIVKNFKSLRDCEVELGKFNVLIGANASGKTNLIEVFKLLRKIYVEKDTNPFLEWWGYNNVVWGGKEELPITVGMLFDVDGYEVYFETTFTGTGGSFRILREVMDAREYVIIEKIGSIVNIKHSEGLIRRINEFPDHAKYIAENHHINELDPIRQDLKNLKQMISQPFSLQGMPQEHSVISLIAPLTPQTMMLNTLFVDSPVRLTLVGVPENYTFVATPFMGDEDNLEVSLLSRFVINFIDFLNSITLRRLSSSVKTPQLPRKETLLVEDASNLIPVLYNIWLREGKLPAEIAEPLSIAFPDTRVFFQLTEDGRVMMKVFEGELELAPPGISDGFYKTLAILTATYLKPPLLIIDEVENSLHPETLELLLDTLKESESQVIITTHSPVVVDMTDPKDVIFVEKIHGETEFKRIPNPEEIKKMLQEKGLAFSEGWLYGEIFKE